MPCSRTGRRSSSTPRRPFIAIVPASAVKLPDSRNRSRHSAPPSATSTSSTRAPAGPRRHQATSESTRRPVALEDRLDGAVGVVPHPARDAERARPGPGLDAEDDALDAARDSGRGPASPARSPPRRASGTKRHGTERTTAGPSGLRTMSSSRWPRLAADRNDEAAARARAARRASRGAPARRRRRRSRRTARARARRASRRRRGPATRVVARRGEVRARLLGELGDPLDRDAPRAASSASTAAW